MTQPTYSELSERLRLTEADREAWMEKYVKAVAELNQAPLEPDIEAIIDKHDMKMEPYSGNSVRGAVEEAVAFYRHQLKVMIQCRNDAVEAARLIAEEKKP